MIYLISSYIFILGLIIGSFINCLLWRMHSNESILGRSYCPKCRDQIAWYDNIPVFSFLFLRGKCRKCKQKISIQYPVVEFITGLLFLLSFLHIVGFQTHFIVHYSSFIIQLFRDLFFISVMVIIFIYDLKYYLILDRITIPSIVIIFTLNLFLGFNLLNLIIGLLVGGGFFLAQFVISRGRWIGGGDIRLGALLGAMFSWPMILLVLFLSYIIGSLVSVPLVLFGGKGWKSQIPFGIFLTSASIISIFFGNYLLNWYFAFIF